jgi:hypothetical protein
MESSEIQNLCEIGQQQLMAMEYLAAEKTLAYAESLAWESEDFDALARLYLPLQEARRQRRQRCGEGIVRLDLCAEGPEDHIDGRHVVENFPHGQLLVAGWGLIEPALQVRQLQARHDLYVDTFLAAVYPIGAGRAVAIVPLADAALPAPEPMSIDRLIGQLPPHSIVLNIDELPKGEVRGSPQSYGQVMDMWERLHQPFLAMADMQADPRRKIEAYRKAIEVDYACELAHQKLSATAREICQTK